MLHSQIYFQNKIYWPEKCVINYNINKKLFSLRAFASHSKQLLNDFSAKTKTNFINIFMKNVEQKSRKLFHRALFELELQIFAILLVLTMLYTFYTCVQTIRINMLRVNGALLFIKFFRNFLCWKRKTFCSISSSSYVNILLYKK